MQQSQILTAWIALEICSCGSCCIVNLVPRLLSAGRQGICSKHATVLLLCLIGI